LRKSEHKRTENKNAGVQDRLRHKGIYCISNGWIKWAKRYMNRSQRRKSKQQCFKNIKEQ